MTAEDETFRLLRRLDYDSLTNIIMSLPQSEFREVYKNAANKSVFFLKYGWTIQEFEDEGRRRSKNALGKW